jgi:hypothetical protein
VRLVVLEPGGGGALLPLDQRGDALELEPGVHPPRVRRVAPRGLVPDVGPQEHRVPALQRLQLLVDHRLRHVAVCATPRRATVSTVLQATSTARGNLAGAGSKSYRGTR